MTTFNATKFWLKETKTDFKLFIEDPNTTRLVTLIISSLRYYRAVKSPNKSDFNSSPIITALVKLFDDLI